MSTPNDSQDQVTRSDVHLSKDGRTTTIVTNLRQVEDIASNTFDLTIAPQTLRHTHDLRATVKTLHRILEVSAVVRAALTNTTWTCSHQVWLVRVIGFYTKVLDRSSFSPFGSEVWVLPIR